MTSGIAASVAIINPAALASELGVAMPVDETVTTVSTSVARGIETIGRRIDKQPTVAVEMRLRNVEPPWALVVSQLRELDRAGVRPGVPTRSATRLAIRPS
jgi:hypothetical protein